MESPFLDRMTDLQQLEAGGDGVGGAQYADGRVIGAEIILDQETFLVSVSDAPYQHSVASEPVGLRGDGPVIPEHSHVARSYAAG
jgi:hypothetical protein